MSKVKYTTAIPRGENVTWPCSAMEQRRGGLSIVALYNDVKGAYHEVACAVSAGKYFTVYLAVEKQLFADYAKTFKYLGFHALQSRKSNV